MHGGIETPVLINIPGIPTVIVMTWLAMLLLIALSLATLRRLSIVPGPLQNVFEFIIESFTHLIETIMGPAGTGFIPFLGTLFLLILVSNIMGVIPGFRAPTSSLNTTVALALIVFFTSHYYGVKNRGFKGYIRHYTGDSIFLAPLMFFTHFVGELARPFSLAIRLFANIVGDDLSLAVILTILPLIAKLVLPLLLPPLMILIGTLIAFIQALVFAVLAAVYIADLAGFNDAHEGASGH